MRKFIKIIAITALIVLLAANILTLTSCNSRVKEDTVYYIDTKESKIMGASTRLFLDTQSKIVLRKDGTATVFIKVGRTLSGFLSIALSQGAISDFDLQPIIDGMVVEFFPGFSLEDVGLTLKILKNSLNLTILGLDPDDPNVTAIFDYINEHGKVPSNITLPEGLGFEYNADYRIKKVTSEYSGEYIGVFMGEQHKNGEPYIIMTLQDQPDSGKKQLHYRNEVMDITLIAKE